MDFARAGAVHSEIAAKGQPTSKLLLQVEKTTKSNVDQVAGRDASCVWDEIILGSCYYRSMAMLEGASRRERVGTYIKRFP